VKCYRMTAQEKTPRRNSWAWTDITVPAVMFAAAAVVWRRPERGLSVLLALGGCALSTAGRRATSQILSSVTAGALVDLGRNEAYLEQILDVISDAVRKAITHNQFKVALKEVVAYSLRDEELQNEMISTITTATIAASKDRGLRSALLSVMKDAVTDALKDEGFMAEMLSTITSASISAAQDQVLRKAMLDLAKEAITDALKDEGFMSDMLSTLTAAAVSASKDPGLRDALLAVTKDAVTDALRDETFMSSFRGAICDSLKDSSMYRAAAVGVVGTLNPFRRQASIDPRSTGVASCETKRPAAKDEPSSEDEEELPRWD